MNITKLKSFTFQIKNYNKLVKSEINQLAFLSKKCFYESKLDTLTSEKFKEYSKGNPQGPFIHTESIKEVKYVGVSHIPDPLFENKLRDKQFQRPPQHSRVLQFIGEQNQVNEKQVGDIIKQVQKNLQEKFEFVDLRGFKGKDIDLQDKIKNLQKNQICLVDQNYGNINDLNLNSWNKDFITPNMVIYLRQTQNIKDNNIYYPEKSQREKIFYTIRDYSLYHEISVQDQELYNKLEYLINIDDMWYLLDTRRITSIPKQKMRPLYNMWHARINSQIEDNPFKGEKLKLNEDFINQSYKIPEEDINQSKCHFEHINKDFNINGFSVKRHIPYIVDDLKDIKSFESYIDPKYLHQDMAIKMPGTDYRVPQELGPIAKEFTEKVAKMFKSYSKHHDEMYAYLTVSNGIQQPFLAQRRPGMHADGFKSYLTHQQVEINDTVFLACNAVCPVFYIEDFETANLDPGKDDLWCNFSSQCQKPYWDGLRPYQIAMVDGFNLHSVAVNKSFKTIQRIFIRIMYSVSKYDRLGNLKNPLFEYNWDMKPQPMQMPPVFWGERQPQYGEQKNKTQELEQSVQNGEKIIYYSDGLWDKVQSNQQQQQQQ